MTYEDCSKDELIHFIKNECFRSDKNLEFCVLMFRSDKTIHGEQLENSKASCALSEYIELLRPYEGKRIIDIPDEVIRKAANYESIRDKAIKKADGFRKEWNRLQKQIDKHLNRKEQSK